MQEIIKITNGITRNPDWRMARPVDFTLCEGEHIAFVGANGSGKSMFVSMFTGAHPLCGDMPKYDFTPSPSNLASENIQYIAFRDAYGAKSGNYFLQLRWNQMEIDKETPLVGQLLEEAFILTGKDTPERRAWQQHLYELFHVEHLLDKYVILMSSGETRKFQLVKTLLKAPRVLVMDNPFIGLDADTRQQLTGLLEILSQEQALQIVLVLSKTDDIPDFITHVVEVENMVVGEKEPLNEYKQHATAFPTRVLSEEKEHEILQLPYNENDFCADEVVKMNHVSIRYGERIILDTLDWTIRNGERWALGGQNGAGKSTLLSLICADNPQSYACDIELFGRPRGTGETIWDIKKHIGYVSPELHRAYLRDLPAIRIVASGLKDSVGLYVKPRPEEYSICRFWMNIFGLNGLEERTFMKLSDGEQRLILLARAFVKDPELLILDEPLHGLDNRNRRLVKDVINAFCHRRNKTLIMVSHYETEFPECITNHKYLIRHV